jgi:hypothetical protein
MISKQKHARTHTPVAHAHTHTITHTHTHHQHTANTGNLRGVDVPQMIYFEKAAKVSRGEKEDLIHRQAGA